MPSYVVLSRCSCKLVNVSFSQGRYFSVKSGAVSEPSVFSRETFIHTNVVCASVSSTRTKSLRFCADVLWESVI